MNPSQHYRGRKELQAGGTVDLFRLPPKVSIGPLSSSETCAFSGRLTSIEASCRLKPSGQKRKYLVLIRILGVEYFVCDFR